jgi:hypothetical protein
MPEKLPGIGAGTSWSYLMGPRFEPPEGRVTLQNIWADTCPRDFDLIAKKKIISPLSDKQFVTKSLTSAILRPSFTAVIITIQGEDVGGIDDELHNPSSASGHPCQGRKIAQASTSDAGGRPGHGDGSNVEANVDGDDEDLIPEKCKRLSDD